MRPPKMIGAHVPSQPRKKRRRAGLYECAKDFSQAFDQRFCATRPQLAWRPATNNP